jgi:hypothetical protein
MSKLVNWGHWLVSGVFAALGCRYLIIAFLRIPELIRITRAGAFSYYLSGKVVLWVPFLVCAWGVWKWRWWGHVIATSLAGLVTLASLIELVLVLVYQQYHILYWILVTLFACGIFLWLLLPEVRTSYWRGNQIA